MKQQTAGSPLGTERHPAPPLVCMLVYRRPYRVFSCGYFSSAGGSCEMYIAGAACGIQLSLPLSSIYIFRSYLLFALIPLFSCLRYILFPGLGFCCRHRPIIIVAPLADPRKIVVQKARFAPEARNTAANSARRRRRCRRRHRLGLCCEPLNIGDLQVVVCLERWTWW